MKKGKTRAGPKAHPSEKGQQSAIPEAPPALPETAERYRTLFEESRDAFYVTTREGTIVDVNQAWLDLFGYSRKEAQGMDIRKAYAPP